jgi:hypothetical protein
MSNAYQELAPSAHALWSPSSAKRRLTCVGSLAMEIDEIDADSEASSEGTTAHACAAEILTTGQVSTVLGVTGDMLHYVQMYVDYIRATIQNYTNMGANVTMYVEVRLPLVDITGEKDSFGTSDIVLVIEWDDGTAEVHVIDLKFGYREVPSSDPQLQVYGLAAMHKYGMLLDIKQVHCTVMQPRVKSEPDTVSYTVEEMEDFGKLVMKKATLAFSILEAPASALNYLQPSEKGCLWCRAKHKCPALVKHVHDTVYGEMQDLTQEGIEPIDEISFDGQPKDFAALLPVFMRRVPQIEAWCKYVRAKVEQQLVTGHPVAGFKLVQGRAGARKFTNETAAAQVLMSNNVPKELFYTSPELRTPADIEKKVKKVYPNVWDALGGLIAQAPGSPSVASVDDPRPVFSAPAFDGESYVADDLI